MKIANNCALLIIDPQNDFCPGGALAVEGGDEIMDGINDLAKRFKNAGGTVVISQDWHPANHKSFASNHENVEPFSITQMPYGPQVLWPDHCIQGSAGAEFHDRIKDGALRLADAIIRKGTNPEVDSYSAYFENDHVTTTGLDGFLFDRGCQVIFIVGLAYDFCVGYSAIDAAERGQNMPGVYVVKDLTRAINMPTPNGSTVSEIEQQFSDARTTVEVITVGEIE